MQATANAIEVSVSVKPEWIDVRMLLTLPQNPQLPGRRLINLLIGSKRSPYMTFVTISVELGILRSPPPPGTPHAQKTLPVYGVADIISVIVLTPRQNVAFFGSNHFPASHIPTGNNSNLHGLTIPGGRSLGAGKKRCPSGKKKTR
jgi:hypothetical protein